MHCLRGAYYEKGRVAKKVHPQTTSIELASDLWDVSARMVGIGPSRNVTFQP